MKLIKLYLPDIIKQILGNCESDYSVSYSREVFRVNNFRLILIHILFVMLDVVLSFMFWIVVSGGVGLDFRCGKTVV